MLHVYSSDHGKRLEACNGGGEGVMVFHSTIVKPSFHMTLNIHVHVQCIYMYMYNVYTFTCAVADQCYTHKWQ